MVREGGGVGCVLGGVDGDGRLPGNVQLRPSSGQAQDLKAIRVAVRPFSRRRQSRLFPLAKAPRPCDLYARHTVSINQRLHL